MKLDSILNFIGFISVILVHSVSSVGAQCNTTCGHHKLPFPFGFSGDCQIQLTCTPDGPILAAGFSVLSVNGDTILVNLPAMCNRPLEALRPLFTDYFAPTSQNAILLRNCPSRASTACYIPRATVQTQFELLDCGKSARINDSYSCYSESDDMKMFMDYENLTKSHCLNLFSAVSMETLANSSSVSLDFQVVRLSWWLPGPCRCSKNARCTSFVHPVEPGMTAYRCECLAGLAGDGFLDGIGCGKGHKHIKWSQLLVIPFVGILLLLSTIFLMKRKCFKQGTKKHMDADKRLNKENENTTDSQIHQFSFATIQIATNNFSLENKLGEGGFGFVYKGKLVNAQEIAIKRLSTSSNQGLMEFKNEIHLIVKLQHNNLVRLLGCCIHKEELMLVYEYMPNKSLDFFLFDPNKGKLLKWVNRLNVIEGIAQGLLYLHVHSRLRVIHRDLKASNILLDQNMTPKISDFGMARIFGMQNIEDNTGRIVGTHGYMSPEYAIKGVVSTKMDVFSFGVLVLEIVSGKKNRRSYHSERPLNLIGLAWELWIGDRAIDLVDTAIDVSSHLNEVHRCINVGLLCVQDSAADRPSMTDVILMLKNELLRLPTPKQPAFFIETSTSTKDIDDRETKKNCTNLLSTSIMEAR